MRLKVCCIFLLLSTALPAYADNIYVVNYGNSQLSIIDSTTNTVTNTVQLPTTYANPALVAVSPYEDYAYVTHYTTISAIPGNQVSVVDLTAATPSLLQTISNIGQTTTSTGPFGIDFSADGNYVFVSNYVAQSITVIDANPDSAAFNTVLTTWSLSSLISSRNPMFLTVNPTTGYGYVACWDPNFTASEYVVVFDTAAAASATVNPIVGTITVPVGTGGGNQIVKVAVNSAGTAGFVTAFNNFGSTIPGYPGVINLSLTPAPGTEITPRPVIGSSFSFYGSYDAAFTPDDSLLLVTVDNTAGSTSYYTTMAFVNPATPTTGTTEIALTTDYGVRARGLAITRDGGYAYAALYNTTSSSGAVAVVNVATRTLVPTTTLNTGFTQPWGVAISRAIGSRTTGGGGTTGPSSTNQPSSEKCFINSMNNSGRLNTVLGIISVLFLSVSMIAIMLARKYNS